MKSLLVLHSSGRVTRSITRRLAQRFATAWLGQNPGGRVHERDLGLNPPTTVNERWIAAAFSDPAARNASMQDALRLSDTLIDEILAADAIVIGAPIYNFGMPAQLKAWLDQIVRIGRTFALQPGGAEPYRPLLPSRPVVVLESAGDGSFYPGAPLAHLNFLEPHLTTVLGFVGLMDVAFIRVGYEESQDKRLQDSLAVAEQAVDEWVTRRFGAKALPAQATVPA